MQPSLSVIVPVGPTEGDNVRLLGDLLLLPHGTELLFVVANGASLPIQSEQLLMLQQRLRVRCLSAVQGRASQQNAGAEAASNEWLWFLHWDSGFGPQLLASLAIARQLYPQALLFCRLQFMADGPDAMWVNQLGANLRSRCLGIPFGDQGFMLTKTLFNRLGGFDECAPYGEDHLLVWTAHQHRVPVRCCGGGLLTSARKYQQQGWLRLTFRYQRYWLRQATKPFIRLLQTLRGP